MLRHVGIVRTAVTDDLDAIAAADHIAASGDAERLRFLRSAVTSGSCLVFVDGEDVSGFVVTRPSHFFGRDFVDLLMVHPSRRRSGIGRQLLRAAVTNAHTDVIFTSTNQSNLAMRGLLASEGWTFSGELAGLDAGDTELVFFIKRA